jgi:hypothetical protein
MAFAMLLEWLQGLTPDRSPNLQAAFCGACVALAAALLAELIIPNTEAAWPLGVYANLGLDEVDENGCGAEFISASISSVLHRHLQPDCRYAERMTYFGG